LPSWKRMTRPPDATLYEESPGGPAGARKAGWSFPRILVRAALLVLALTPLLISLSRHTSELRASLQDIAWAAVILGQVGFLVLLPMMASLFAVSWATGFVVVFAPGGLGVREAVLALRVGGFLSLGHALSRALISRFCRTAAEAVWIVVSRMILLPWQGEAQSR
jgi:hypothetical protein